jgi:hypothetical protein
MTPDVVARVDAMWSSLGLDRRSSLVPGAERAALSPMARVVEVARDLLARARP